MIFFNILGATKRKGNTPAIPVPSTPPDMINEGEGGDNTNNVLARMSTILAHNGDMHIVMLGTNDWRHPTASKRNTPADFKTNLKNIISQIKATGSAVTLMSFPPIVEGSFTNASAADYLTAIDEIIIEDSVLFVDNWQKFVDIGQPTTNSETSYMQTDGVHIKPIGNEYIAQNIVDVTNLTSYSKIVCVGDSLTFGQGVTGQGTATGETYPAYLLQKLS